MKIRKVIYEEIEIDRSELLTTAEAARILGLSLPGVIRAVERGDLREVIDEGEVWRKRRLIMAEDVRKLVAFRAAGGRKKPYENLIGSDS